MKLRGAIGILAFAIMVVCVSCKSSPSKSYQGKIKRGKAVPCPVKDC